MPLFKAGAGGKKPSVGDDDDDGDSGRPWGQLAPRRRPRVGHAMAWHSRAQGWELDARRLRFNASGQLANCRLARRGAGRPRRSVRGAALPQPVSSAAPPGRDTRGDPGRARLRAAPASPQPGDVCSPASLEWGSLSPLSRSCLREPCPARSAGTPLLCPPQAVRALSPPCSGSPAALVPSSSAKPLVQSSVSSSVGTPAPTSSGTPVPPSSKPHVPSCPQASPSPCSAESPVHFQSSVSSPHLQGALSPYAAPCCPSLQILPCTKPPVPLLQSPVSPTHRTPTSTGALVPTSAAPDSPVCSSGGIPSPAPPGMAWGLFRGTGCQLNLRERGCPFISTRG